MYICLQLCYRLNYAKGDQCLDECLGLSAGATYVLENIVVYFCHWLLYRGI